MFSPEHELAVVVNVFFDVVVIDLKDFSSARAPARGPISSITTTSRKTFTTSWQTGARESIGDLGGAKVALHLAYRRESASRRQAAPGGHWTASLPEQQFSLHRLRGQIPRRRQSVPEAQRLMVQGDPHPIAKIPRHRPAAPIFRNFKKAWSCKTDAAK